MDMGAKFKELHERVSKVEDAIASPDVKALASKVAEELNPAYQEIKGLAQQALAASKEPAIDIEKLAELVAAKLKAAVSQDKKSGPVA